LKYFFNRGERTTILQFETLATGYGLLEGPRIDERNRLYYSDARGGGVFRRSPDGTIETLIGERKMVGGIALNQGGGLIITGATVSHWDEKTGSLTDIFSQWEGKPLFGMNDLTIDDQGSLWGGTFGIDINQFDFKSTPPPGSLFRIDPPGKTTKLWEGVEVTNGLGFSPDRKLLYHNDSTTRAVWVYDVRSVRTVGDRRLFARLPEGMPDGLTVDAEGGVWVAVVFGAGEVVRFKSDGVLDQRIKVPAKTVTSLAFGGTDMCDLYVVTADNSENRDLKGTIFRARSQIAGLPVPNCRF
jgi:D-xylonolactonase